MAHNQYDFNGGSDGNYTTGSAGYGSNYIPTTIDGSYENYQIPRTTQDAMYDLAAAGLLTNEYDTQDSGYTPYTMAATAPGGLSDAFAYDGQVPVTTAVYPGNAYMTPAGMKPISI